MTKTANLGIPEKEGGRRIFNNWLYVLSVINFSLPGHRTKGINLFIAMNLLFVFTLATCLTVHATSFSQKVTFKGENVPILQVFSAIKDQTGYLVIANAAILDKMPGVTISATNMLLHDFLAQILQEQPLQFSIKYATIVISPKDTGQKNIKNQADVSVPFELDQTLLHKLTIRVLDSDGSALSGATVTNKKTKSTSLTGANGNYELNANIGDVLEITFIGFEKQLYTVKDNTPLVLIRMKVATNNLDEVMYTAYGKTSRRLSTGDIVKISGEDIQKVPVMNPLLALEGRVSGLIISKTTGYASSPVSALLRGKLNLNSAFAVEPLYVVDGIPLIVANANAQFGATGYDQTSPFSMGPTMGLSPLFLIQSMDIESIEVLKDADALAIYGAQAAYGAILITTKKAKAGPVSYKFTIDKGITKALNNTPYLSTSEYLEMRRASFRHAGQTPTALLAPDLLLWDTTRNVNWMKELYGQMGVSDMVTLSASGGQQQMNFSASGSYATIKEIASAGGSTQRLTFSGKFGFKSLNNRFIADVALSMAQSNVDVRYGAKDFTLPPNAPPIYDSLGNYNWVGWLTGQNALTPLYRYTFAGREQLHPMNSNLATAKISLNYTLGKGIVLSVDAQKSVNGTQSKNLTPIKSLNPSGNIFSPSTGTAKFSHSSGKSYNVSPKLRYNLKNNWGALDVLLAFSYNQSSGENLLTTGTGYTSDFLLESISGAAVVRSENKLLIQKAARLFGIINYNFANKYLLSINMSKDGSTKFGPGNKFGNFGSMGLGWIISDESWIKNWLPASISFLKLKGSYGFTGGDQIGDYQYISQWGAGIVALNPYGGVVPLKKLFAANPNYKWQVAKKRSVTLDIGFFKDRLNIGLTNYDDRMGNQLVSFPLSIVSGFDNVTANYPAITRNAGWELSVSATPLNNKLVTWSLGFNISRNKNILLKYPDFEQSPYRNTYKIGKPISILPVLHYTGPDPLTGEPTYLDRNNDGSINGSVAGGAPGEGQDDRNWIDLTPEFYGGIQSNFRYKNWIISTNFSFNSCYVNDPVYRNITASGKNIPVIVYENVWKEPGDKKRFPRITSMLGTADLYFNSSDAIYVDAFYMMLNTISVQHTISPAFVSKLKLKHASIGINTNDLFSVALSGNYRPNAVTTGNPLTRTVSLKLDIGF